MKAMEVNPGKVRHTQVISILNSSVSLFIFETVRGRICWCSWQCWFGSGPSVCEWRNEGASARCGQVNMIWFWGFWGASFGFE